MTDLNNTVQDQIDDDYKAAFKGKNKDVYMPLRMLLSAIKQETIDSRKELNNDEVLAVIKKETKKLKDAVTEFEKGGREDLAAENKTSIELYSKYLPAEMSDDDLEAVVTSTLEEMGISSKADMGKAMGAVMGKVNGQADGNRVKEMVMKQLS